MNRAFRLIWNPIQNAWIVASEIAKGRGKSTLEKKCVISAIIVSMTPLSLAAPTDGKISAGTGSITQTGQNTNINQSSQNLAINWQSFSIGANEAVNFNQPNTSSITLNRIIGQNPSSILGQISANGQVFLINPNGVLFGTGSKVNVGGLVASTLELSDTDFMAGKHTFSGTNGNILNQGTLTATQKGYIALLAPEVRNDGVISATLGTALLAAGNKVTLSLNSGSLLDYNIDQGALQALADNKQLIQADGGQVFISAKAANALSTAVVNNTGIIQAHTVKNINGTIKLMGDMQSGTVNVGGTLNASAPSGGNGGFIETSAAHVHVANDTHITSKAPHGQSGTWLIDPVDFTIAASGADMTGTAVTTALANGNVSIQSVNGKTGTKGDINVNDTINWSANKLTLSAQNNININAVMNASSSASLALEFGQGAVAAGNTSNIITGKNGVVNLPASTTNFTTKQGSDGGVNHYTVITSLGAEGSTTTTDLQGISGNDNLNYALGANIDATTTTNWDSGAGFKPVGLKATFNGLGHTISELTINRSKESNIGLFSSIDNTASISNIGLIGGSIAGNQSVGALVGAIQSGSINNSYATSSVKGNNFSVGGLVGISMSSATISNSYATGSVKGYDSVGGLVGDSSCTTISNSFATGSVEGDRYNVGGLVGNSSGTTISNSYATGSVKG
ncbi:MAG: filamentous hemagglutinin N-terminal domain-containing protein, partial [Oceanospirillaceae bacterium]|nr:filamentous hemagglutinin N-terminal domain-containing protein [Oceanospirillaceae bacterium]